MSEFFEILKKKEVKKFIHENLKTDIRELILHPPKAFKDDIKLIADQILSRQKAKNKLPSWAENFDLIMPAPISLEQASSESTANYKKNLWKGDHLIDLTGGMGIDCLTLSEQFSKTTYVDQQESLAHIFEHNASVLGKEIEVLNDEALHVVKSIAQDQNVCFFIDPARRDESKNKVFKLEDCSPNLHDLIPELKKKGAQALIKLSPLVDIHSVLSAFDCIKEVHVVSVKNECKELLILLDFNHHENVKIIAANLETEQATYAFEPTEELETESVYSLPKTYLYEPNASILKAGAFKKIGVDFGLKKLHQHTHLYTSEHALDAFPGKTFKIVDTANKQSIKKFGADGKMNVMTRNYPLKPEALKKKWKLKDGGNYFLIGLKDLNGKSTLLIAERV